MRLDPIIQRIFGHFQNLNLLVLLDDLRTGRIARGAWSVGPALCPVAHGMPEGQAVSGLQYLGQAEVLGRACDYAARQLGAVPKDVEQFVELWDSEHFSTDWLIRQLEAMWRERREDADAVQAVLGHAPRRKPAATRT